MPVFPISASGESYYLLVFDKDGVEIPENGELLSEKIKAGQPACSDVFFFIHGWKGDIPEAKAQYDRWIGAMIGLKADYARMAARSGGFCPLWVGLHWPSLPWGNERVDDQVSFALGAAEKIVNDYLERLGGDEGLRVPLRLIVGRAQEDASPASMPEDVASAYEELNSRLGLPAEGVAGSVDGDRMPFDPHQSYENAKQNDALAFGGNGLGASLLSPLQQLSFWTMKKRARTVGETGFHPLLAKLMDRLGPHVRFHVMGHSFGCIAASATICGPVGAAARSVSSLALVQGALSLWSYCADIPLQHGTRGYFSRIAADGLVSGPTITTQSKADRAVSFFYPLAAGVAGQVAYGEALPLFGGVGRFGAQGMGAGAQDMAMLPSDGEYRMTARTILNLEATRYICRGGGLSGAHSDIAGPEVAHAVWSAAIQA